MQEIKTNKAADVMADEENGLNASDNAVMLVMDGTSVPEFSVMQNQEFVSEQLARARDIYNLEKLEALKEDKDAFLNESSHQAKELLKCSESLTAHHNMYNVLTLKQVGEVLNTVEEFFQKKSRYMKWVRENFPSHAMQTLQHAKQIARMGEFAEKYAAAGVNRLRYLDALMKEEGSVKLLDEYPLPDMTKDGDSKLLKLHIDALLTSHRLQKEGIDCVSFDQAKLIASTRRHALEVSQAKKLAAKLKDNNLNQQEYLENWLMNGCVWRNGEAAEKPSGISRLIAQVKGMSANYNLTDTATLNDVKAEDLRQAFQAISALAQILNVDLTASTQNASLAKAA